MTHQEAVMEAILRYVADERKRQIAKWGVQTHAPVVWNAILVEEVGEVSEAILHQLFNDNSVPPDVLEKELITELVQVAAVAVAFIEYLVGADHNAAD